MKVSTIRELWREREKKKIPSFLPYMELATFDHESIAPPTRAIPTPHKTIPVCQYFCRRNPYGILTAGTKKQNKTKKHAKRMPFSPLLPRKNSFSVRNESNLLIHLELRRRALKEQKERTNKQRSKTFSSMTVSFDSNKKIKIRPPN